MTHKMALEKLRKDIRLRGYSPNTLRTYISFVTKFLDYQDKPVDELNEEHIRNFLSYLIEVKKLTPGSVNLYSAAIRFFFAVTLNRYMNYLQVPRMKRPKSLPVLLSRNEVEVLLNCCSNLKHKAMILLAYGSGLRISEVCRIRIVDIDSDEMRLFVCDGKGSKDRYTILGQYTLDTLRAYYRAFHPKSLDGYLFPGCKNIGHITHHAVHSAFNRAMMNASLDIDASFHTLRHCFATYLLEDGYSLLQIKDLLGHSSIESTTVYLHLANTTRDVVSPADKIENSSIADES